jgi:acetyltransferase-like isoleucine patch superfamily enzyme
MVAAECKVVGNDHLYSIVGTPTRLAFSPSRTRRRVTVLGADVWIGRHAILREGIRIGDGAVIGAGSVVTRDVAPYSVVAGAPARPIRRRFGGEETRRHVREIFAE